ncbi:PAS domain S-box protein [Chroococcidiopsis sp. CCMEE 29]|uniref:PAS domain S-box protein n=1 Tax=Chroococcidiopsis sp. CCMEE 29 TaxID=155894 RepID=UPI00202090F4|nr:PAS domain S-box protein [Chroococcidiopsis sp. CCMEE 29]
MVGVVCHEHVGSVREWALDEQNFAGSIADLVSMAMQACDRQQAEEVRSQLAAIVESSDDAIISKTLDGMIVSWNSSAERIYGYTAEEVKHRHGSMLVPPDRLNEEPQILQRIRQGERIENYETVRVRKDGRQIDVSLTISPVKDAAGNIIGSSKIARDITQRKQAEEELAKRERYLAALVEVQRRLLTSEAPRNYYTKVLEPLGQAAGASRVYVFENHQDAAGRLLMSQRAEWCNQDIQAEIDNSNLQNLAYDDFFPRWIQALAQGEIIAGKVAEFPESERMILMPQGILSILVLPLMVNGEFFGLIGFDNCIEAYTWKPLEVNLLAVAAAAISLNHERKQAEEARRESQQMLQLVMDNIPQFIYWKDRNSVYLGCNRNFVQLAGVGNPENIVGKTDYDLPWRKEEANFFHERDRQVMETNTPKYHVVETLIRADGQHSLLGTNKVPLHDSEGNVVGLLGTFADITERKQADEKIKASLKEKEVLLKEIHHRVKNNLQIISSLLKLQSGYIKDKHTLEMFKDSQSRIRSMALIHEKLYQSQDLSKVDFAEYITNLAANLFRSYELDPTAINSSLNVESIFLEIDVAVPCGLIINELVSNSLKYAFPDRRKGEIRIHLHSDNQHEIKLIVGDNGIGLPKDFDFQKTGTLGLQLVNNLVEQLEGTIEVNGHSGTEFRIKFAI